MNGKIDKQGNLFVERAGAMRAQVCPYSHEGDFCGDHCPKFGEPRKTREECFGSMIEYVLLSVCGDELTFVEFADERG